VDDYNRIQQSIEFMEDGLQEELRIAEIATAAGFSAFHYQRLFHLISGFTVHEYIRKRRLTEAAARLRVTNRNVLDIAVAFQYGSHEAFTRAFANQFGVTPAEYRKVGQAINGQERIDFLAFPRTPVGEMEMNKPVIVQLDKLTIVGYEYKTSLHEDRYFADIPRFYPHFGRNGYYLRIPYRAKPEYAYGIGYDYEDNGDFSFLIGEQVERLGALDEGFVSLVLPEGKYAEFRVGPTPDGVQNAWRYIYGTWLPSSNYERREGLDYEVTDVLRSSPEHLETKIYIPIQ
jgi:AraC family transcriptional regulator